MTNLMTAAKAVGAAARAWNDDRACEDELLERIGNARFVLIGEASHGTHEFYRERARLTRRLIQEHGFSAVAVEADWPDAYRVNRFVRGEGGDATPEQALGDFQRFPKWMWRNEDVVAFTAWLREHNARQPERAAGFLGIDLYSLHRSMDEVVAYLDRVDPEAAKRARRRYSCFDPFEQDPQQYGLATMYHSVEPCEDEVVAQLVELQRRESELARGGLLSGDEHFHAEQNARLAVNAERYYRAMFRGRDDTWNLRDTHMADTIDALAEHLASQGRSAKVVVWAHNSHLGDARATDMGWKRGELNVGQLMRERHPGETFLLGLTTHHGEVTAADDWGGPARRRRVRPGLKRSYEQLLHEVGLANFWLDLRERNEATHALSEGRLQRFIGVIYRPETERWSHYSETRLTEQYDAVLHLDETTALAPLDPTSGWTEGEAPDTYPTGE
ncbi:erythromycin esterase family protein [Deinococcus yavapaiensis]|uniref:Erythromycin esterase-like protein n=1 Tax=Deinococcus yavapaiensis KR-236 TaxID=694435 RepID=A0A318S2N4_9DEIO|nr:erythromycin esterase family protein [Deinococcus yavapaiensis]PYE52712.1 erythromycin esterase-like protein [Deinococcus yavapaiensis KR-236]